MQRGHQQFACGRSATAVEPGAKSYAVSQIRRVPDDDMRAILTKQILQQPQCIDARGLGAPGCADGSPGSTGVDEDGRWRLAIWPIIEVYSRPPSKRQTSVRRCKASELLLSVTTAERQLLSMCVNFSKAFSTFLYLPLLGAPQPVDWRVRRRCKRWWERKRAECCTAFIFRIRNRFALTVRLKHILLPSLINWFFIAQPSSFRSEIVSSSKIICSST